MYPILPEIHRNTDQIQKMTSEEKRFGGNKTEVDAMDMTALNQTLGHTQNHAGDAQINDLTLGNIKAISRGPIKNRSCTDVICTAIFLLFIAGYVLISIFAYKNGNPRMLLYPTDSEGNRCGLKTDGDEGKDMTDKPFLLFFDLTECFASRLKNPLKTISSLRDLSCPTPQICVESCPDSNSFYSHLTSSSRRHWPCQYDVTEEEKMDKDQFNQLVRQKRCAAFTVHSGDLLKRCIPGEGNAEDLLQFVRQMIDVGIRKDDNQALNQTTSTSSFRKALNSFLVDVLDVEGTMDKLMTDFSTSWPFLIALLTVACLICLLWILAMRWIAPPMVWFSLVSFIAIFAFCTYYCSNKYFNDPNIKDMGFEFTSNLQTMKSNRKTWMVLSIISASSLVIVLLILVFLRDRIKIAIELIKESSKAIGSIASSLFFPIFPFVLQLSLFSGWAATMLYLASSTKPIFVVSNSSSLTIDLAESRNASVKEVVDGSICDRKSFNEAFGETGALCLYSHDGPDPTDPFYGQFAGFSNSTTWAKVYLIFGLLWFMNFIVAFGEMTLAGAFASWYWVLDKKNGVPNFPLLASLWRCLRYHIGTLAFGSLIIAIVQFIRMILEYVDQKLKKNRENEVAKFIMKCLQCCFWCLEKFLKFINRNAYIMTAVKGSNFCTSSRQAFMLILENCVRALVLDKVVDFLLFVGKVTVVGAMGLLSLHYYNGQFNIILPKAMQSDINYIYVPVIIIVLATYMVSSGFFSVYAMAVDTLFLCFLEDLEKNDGSAEKPYFMSKNLMKILGKSNKEKESKSKCCHCF